MAYIKIFPIKATVKKAINYITNPDKTDEKLLISSFGCAPETAYFEFQMTQEMGKRNVMEKGSNLAWHMIQSFKPGEVSAEQAHEIGKQFADSVLKGKYEYVISTHIDKGHVHNHIIFNSTSFIDYHKFSCHKRDYHKICKISNRICHEYGLSESMPKAEKGKSYKENMEYRQGTSWKAKLKVAIDKAIWSSVTYDEFLLKMKQAGYEIRQGKYLAFRAPEQKNFTNMKSLGSYYTEESVMNRIIKNRQKQKLPKNLSREIQLFINITAYVSTGDQPGFEKWAERHNLKEAAKTFNYLSEHNLLNYENFQNHVSDLEESVQSANARKDELASELKSKQLIQKHCATYRACKQIVDEGKSISNPAQYKKKHAKEYALHKSSKQALHDLGIERLPNPNRLDQQIIKLQEQISATEHEIQKLKKQQTELSTVQSNFQNYFITDHSEKSEHLENENSL